MLVDVFIPCYMDQIYPETAENMIKVLEKAGCKVNYNPEQTCCGQPAFNAGYWDHCKEVGEKFIREFSNDRYVIIPSASCTGMVRNYYPEMFHNSVLHNEYKQLRKNTIEFTDFMVNVLKVTNVGAVMAGTAAFMDSCSGLRECKIKDTPRALLSEVKGLDWVELSDGETCCGFGGTFAVKYEPISVGMAQQKVEDAMATGADYLVSTDISCLMHLEGYIRKQGLRLRTMHVADVLAAGW